MLFTASHLTRALVFAAALATTPAVFAHAHLKNQYPAANAEVTAPAGINPQFLRGH
jgi:methionine-rich copper-binding protein CopC